MGLIFLFTQVKVRHKPEKDTVFCIEKMQCWNVTKYFYSMFSWPSLPGREDFNLKELPGD